MDEEKVTSKYSSIIARSIQDFDAIFGKLIAKGVVSDGNKLTVANMSDGNFPTNTYAGFIDEQLFGIEGKVKNQITVDSTSLKVKYLTAITGTPTITQSGTAITVSGTAGAAGYYPADATITYNLTGEAITLSTSAADTTYYDSTENAYLVVPSSGNLLASVKVAKGAINPAVTLTPALSSTAELSIDSTGTTVTGTSVLANGGTANGFTVKVNAQTSYSGTITKALTPNLTAGFIKEVDLTNMGGNLSADETIAKTNSNAVPMTVVIPDAAISGAKAVATHSLNISGMRTTNAADGIAVTAKIDSLSVDRSGMSVTAGYIDGAGKNHSAADAISFADSTIPADEVQYIAKAELGTAASNAKSVVIDGELNLTTVSKNASNKDVYATDLSVSDTFEKAFDANSQGYVLPNTTLEANISGTRKIEIAKGAAAIEASTTIADPSASGGTIISNTATGYSITVSASSATTKNVTEGYIKAADVTLNNGDGDSKVINIKAGEVTAAGKLAVNVVNREETPVALAAGTANIFLSAAPETGDYFEITGSAEATKVEGYVSAGTVVSAAGANEKKYLPKAVLKFVEGDTDEKSFIEVQSGGYLPSGVINTIAEITGTPDYAAVQATLSGSVISSGATVPAGAYAISIAKNTSGTNSGYITGSQGTLSLDQEYYIAKGAATVSAAATDVVLTATPVKEAGKFKFATKSSGTGKVVTSYAQDANGYQTIADVSGIDATAHTLETAVGASLTLDPAEYGIKAGSKAELGKAATTNVAAAEAGDTAFHVDVEVSNGTITTVGTSAGYLEVGAEADLTVTADKKVVYIKSGVAPTGVTNTTPATGKDYDEGAALTTAVGADNSLTVTYPGQNVNVSGAIAEGYYKNQTASGVAKVGASEKVVAAAAATASLAGSTTISSASVTIHADNSGTGTYLPITATNDGAITVAVGTKGYLNDKAQVATSGSVGSATVYLEVAPDTATAGDTTEVLLSQAQQTTVLPVAGTYNQNNITVSLGAHAMGSSVVAELQKLEQRLNGELTSA